MRMLRVQAHAAVALALGGMEGRMRLARCAQAARHVALEAFELLHAHDVPWLDAREPAREALALGGAQAVDVAGDDAHGSRMCRWRRGRRGAVSRTARDYNRRARRREPRMPDFRQEFLAFSMAREVLRFGQFITKAGRSSPYFFNAGLFNDGESLRRLGGFYANALLAAALDCDQLFGPAYKGITLAAATAIALAEKGHNLPYSYNRKEAKDHGEGGTLVGAPLSGRVVIVDDVITAGTSVRESVELIKAAGATPAGVLIALDRMERGQGDASAVDEVRERFGIP